MVEFVLCVRACEDCQVLPVFRVVVPSDVLDFFSKVVGWTFDDWVKEKLNKKGIVLPAEWWLEHPIFTLRRFDRACLLALPEVVLQ